MSEKGGSLSPGTLRLELKDDEKEVLRRQIDTSESQMSRLALLYTCTTFYEILLLVISSIAAIIGGALQPVSFLLLGGLAQAFKEFFIGTSSGSHLSSLVAKFALYYVYIAIGQFVSVYISTAGFMIGGEKITQRLREKYLAAILRQNIAFFDVLGAGEITARITSDMNLIQDSLTGKLSLTLYSCSNFGAALIISFVESWRMAFILISAYIAETGSMAFFSSFMVKYTHKSLAAYADGSTAAEEAISSIRHVTAFGIQDKLADRYQKFLIQAEKYSLRGRIALAAMMAVMNGVIFWTYGLTFWQGSRYLVVGDVELGALITILLATLTGAFTFGNIAPNFQAFSTGIAATGKILATVSRESPLDPSSTTGRRLEAVSGTIELKRIRYVYPSRPDVLILDDVNLRFPAGKTTAIVGASGCGKSTLAGLVERFYEPLNGEILLDGHDIASLNLQWYRQQIAIVTQQPTLFATTVFQNIRFGLIGTEHENSPPEVIESLVFDAAKTANCFDFIANLPKGFHTSVGERGSLLSGGQKQRVAIARAIISNPKVLLLDEATSALDAQAERLVQAALDVAAKGRTTITISHRLSTITAAENIVVMSHGGVVEQGTHSDLLEKRSVYYELVEKQRMSTEREVSPSEENSTFGIDVELPGLKDEGDESNKHTYQIGQDSISEGQDGDLYGKADGRYSLWELIKFVANFNKQETFTMLWGLIFSVITGAGNPTQAVFYGKAIAALSLPPNMYGQLRHDVNFWSLMYLMLGCTAFLGWGASGLCFAYCSERLVHRARDSSFRAILHQDISMFDKPGFSAGSLTAALSTDATNLAGISGVTLGSIFIVSTTLIAGVAVSIAIGWKLGLVCTATIPIVLTCGLVRLKLLGEIAQQSKAAYAASAAYACEASSAIKTVASLNLETHVQKEYHTILETQRKKSVIATLKSSMFYAASQSANFLCIALAFWYGGSLIIHEDYSMVQFFIAYAAVIAGAFSAGAIFSFAPDMSKSRQAAQDIKTLLSQPVAIDTRQETGEQLHKMDGSLEIRNIYFRYSSRPESVVLNGLSLSVQTGQYIGLVGASGCGKSTIISLLERFFDPEAGTILVDGKDISKLNIKSYRSHLALVSQEPTLYQGTIRENIIIGTDDDNLCEERVVQACKDANIYDFILSLPDGFSTVIGARGGMLSGGQQQRIAIARALLRDPRILLLDEATSALDSESEKVVQDALNAAAQGRTTVAVAHRISTVQKADCIYVLHEGNVVEQGTHQELMALGGRYFELVKLQSLGSI
ncbi:ABC transporter, integral membrane type 1 [Penicillium griseofulvum]|uniref:ABC transporter, integral membrane type 1 n=1 Tax=Penicillium patulum TaxID=5078 RepID=A0A135LR98_PENPA|nr:ABC transporter, integral membrane type 1 [Penicillium griseofulvum]KXG51504.1 ABC transporter, integral membrane type 1 [Penicillium griseofulvum]